MVGLLDDVQQSGAERSQVKLPLSKTLRRESPLLQTASNGSRETKSFRLKASFQPIFMPGRRWKNAAWFCVWYNLNKAG
jgi:hypothetical protein